MFAVKARTEFAFRMLLIAAFLFGAPLNSFAAFANGATETATAPPTGTETPTPELSATPVSIALGMLLLSGALAASKSSLIVLFCSIFIG